MAEFVQHSGIQTLAWALLHFLWQGAAIGLASFIAFRLTRSASIRYAIGVGALVAMIAAPITTAMVLGGTAAAQTAVGAATDVQITLGLIASNHTPTDASATAAAGGLTIAPEGLGIAVLAWLAGVAFFGIRLIGGWVVARRLTRRAVQPVSDHIQVVARRLADRLAVDRAVAILQSSAVVVPVMVGWLKPAVILPVAALAGLSPSQLEALLAHELAHVRRQDYLVNLLQSVAEALLFYHPAVWWLSRRVRAERELCCDDLAVSVCDPLVYATALTDLAAMTSPGLALAATDGDLLGRVRRILGQSEVVPTMRTGAMPLLALVLVAGVAAPVALASTQAPQAPVVVRPVEAEVAPPVSAPATVEGRTVVMTRAGEAAVLEGEPVTLEQTAQQQAEQQAEQQRAEELKRQLAELKRAIAQLEAEQVQLARERASVEARKTNEAAQTTREQQTSERRQAELELARAKTLFERGVVSAQQLRDAEAAVAKAAAAGNPEALQKVELQMAMEKLARSRELVQKGLISPQDLAALEDQLKRMAVQLEEVRAKRLEVAPDPTQAASAKELYALLAQRKAAAGEQAAAAEQLKRAANENLMREVQARPERVREVAPEGQPVAANEPARVGDYVRIDIDGEDLRMNYRVGDEGTIKMPLIGAIKVVGLTAAQVRDAVGKQLAAHKLKTVEQVKVTLTRAR